MIKMPERIVRCRRCGRTLTNPDSISRRIGPICLKYIIKKKKKSKTLDPFLSNF